MQGMKALLLMVLLSPITLANNHRDTTLYGVNMRFQGEIVVESCRVYAGDQQMTINLGQISSNQFHGVGSDTTPVPFAIHLQDCNTSVSQRVGIAFRGVADSKNPNVLSIGNGTGTAVGIGVALFDAQDQLIPLNYQPLTHRQLRLGSEVLHFVAKYRATSREVAGGIANAQVWFALTYD